MCGTVSRRKPGRKISCKNRCGEVVRRGCWEVAMSISDTKTDPFLSTGERASSNAEIVEEIVGAAHQIGRKVVDSQRTREIIGIGRKNNVSPGQK